MNRKNLTAIIAWAKEVLLTKGYLTNGEPEIIQITPWSSVSRFSTTMGYIYLKETPPSLSLEPIIIRFLHEKFLNLGGIPIVIETNKALNCFLMQGSGQPLRDFLKKDFQPELLHQAIKQYTNIQEITKEYIDILIKLGVPDWRLDKIPNLYSQLIAKEELLKTDGMTNDEFNLLHNLKLKLSSMCELLANYKIPATLDHCDFHDKNVMIDANTHNLTIIDWGETVITHPFFSLITFLNTAVHRHALKENEKIYLELQDECFKGWSRTLAKDKLTATIILAKNLWPIYTALGFYRLMASSSPTMVELKSLTGRLSGYFREFIKAATINT